MGTTMTLSCVTSHRPAATSAPMRSSRHDHAAAERTESGTTAAPARPVVGGLQAVSSFLEANVPEAERERASDVLVRILNGTLFELPAGPLALRRSPLDRGTRPFAHAEEDEKDGGDAGDRREEEDVPLVLEHELEQRGRGERADDGSRVVHRALLPILGRAH